MKTLIFTLLVLLNVTVHATSDGLAQTYIVVEDYNQEDSDRFQLMLVAINGCYGLVQGPQLAQFTAPYEVQASIGCGYAGSEKTNLNALTCAKVLDSEEFETTGTFKKIVLDISACEAKNNKRFITMIRTAAKRNFPVHHENRMKEVELVLKK
jgi:hypothetical protein